MLRECLNCRIILLGQGLIHLDQLKNARFFENAKESRRKKEKSSSGKKFESTKKSNLDIFLGNKKIDCSHVSIQA